MPSFSPSDAALEGFRVLQRHWRVVVGWALFNVIALVVLGVIGAVLAFGAEAASTAGALRINGAVGSVLGSLAELAVIAVLAGGLFRLMLRPDEPAYLHLRIGPDEARVLAVWLVMAAAWTVLSAFTALLVGAGRQLGVWGAAALWLAGAALVIWLMVRFSLASVITFAERRFTLRASWRLTDGQVWALLGMWLLSVVATAMVAMAVIVAVLVPTGLGLGFGAVAALFDPGSAAEHPGVYAAAFGAEVLLFPAFLVLLLAPWVAAYQALRGEGAA